MTENSDISLSGINAKSTNDGKANMILTLEISSTQEMARLFNKFKSIPGMIDVYRAKN